MRRTVFNMVAFEERVLRACACVYHPAEVYLCESCPLPEAWLHNQNKNPKQRTKCCAGLQVDHESGGLFLFGNLSPFRSTAFEPRDLSAKIRICCLAQHDSHRMGQLVGVWRVESYR